jgi:hypothetical protein
MKLINFIRPVIIVFGALLICLSAFIFYHFNEDYQLNYALEAFLKKDFLQAKHNLEMVKKNIPTSQYYLSLSYISKEQGKHSLSKQLLNKSLNSTKKGQSQLHFEILINKAIASYIIEDFSSFSEEVKEMKKLPVDFTAAPLFAGLDDFAQNNFELAIQKWSPIERQDFSKSSKFPWLNLSFNQVFPENFLTLKIIEAKVEQGRLVESRKGLENFLKKDLSEQDSQKAHYLLGRSYLVEAISKPIEVSGPYFELAKTYFENLPIHNNEHRKQKEKILEEITGHAESNLFSFSNPSLDHISPIISFLENWKAKNELNHLSFELLSAFQKDDFSQDLEDKLISQTKEISSKNPMFLSSLRKYLSSDIAQSILENKFSNLKSYWSIAKELDAIDQDLEDKVAPMMQNSITELLQNPEKNLDYILSYIEFYKINITSAQHRLKLAKKVTKISGAQWMERGKEKNALKLMIAVDQALEEGLKRFLKDDIKILLQNVYLNAVQDHDKEKIVLVHDAVKYFDLKISELSLNNASAEYTVVH